MALDYDFYIGSLGWNKRIGAQSPYERATAQFRKDQFDQAPVPGDQSLTGWWTRGQLSFHKGAGVTYYEVLDGPAALNRFDDSDSVDVFKPGEVTLSKAFAQNGLATIDAVPAPLSFGGGVYALTASGVQYTAGAGSTSIATSDGGVPTAICSGGGLYYVVNGSKIEQQYNTLDARTNHVTNPSGEVDATGWSSEGVGDSVSTSSATAKYGSRSISVSSSGVRGGAKITVSGLTVGQVYVVSGWVKRTNLGSGIDLKMSGTTVSSIAANSPAGWARVFGTYTATATSHVLEFRLQASTTFDNFNIDSVIVTESPFTDDYFDGSYPGCSWAGTPGLSKSTRPVGAVNASTVVLTHSSPQTWSRAWWAKGRLWAVDSDGYFYAKPAAAATLATTDAFWNSGRKGAKWSLTDSPGPVYISDGNEIFAVTLSTDGLVPSVSAPVSVARLPLGEEVSRLTYYLSNLVVTTSRGVRIAVVTDSGAVQLGPLILKGDFSATNRTGLYDTKVFVTGRLEGHGGAHVLCAIDLAQVVDDFVYAWSPVVTVSSMASSEDGAVVDAAGRVYAWSARAMIQAPQDNLSPSGYVRTGFHRFGTLESKFFSMALVRTKGTAGSVAVYRVDDDESETLLTTITLPASETEVGLGLADPAERVALKFVLSPDASDATKGPTLLGYQLKALPVPKRQRMIRVPLMLLDRETNRSGQKMAGDPWDRLAALEALEESSAVVTFEDRETGERGSAFIEAVEVSRTAAAARNGDGFGGLIYVTLRKI